MPVIFLSFTGYSIPFYTLLPGVDLFERESTMHCKGFEKFSYPQVNSYLRPWAQVYLSERHCFLNYSIDYYILEIIKVFFSSRWTGCSRSL